MPAKLSLLRSFRGKLYAVFALLLILVTGLGITGYFQLSNVSHISDSLVDTAAAHSLAQDLAVGLAELDSNLEDFVVLGDEDAAQSAEENLGAIGDTLASLRAQVADGSGFAADVDVLIDETTLLSADIKVLMESGRLASPRRKQVIGEIAWHVELVRGLYNDFNADSLGRVEGQVVEQADILDSISLQLFLLVAIILAILMVTSLYVRSTVQSIGSVTDTALAIASGDIEREVPIHRRDEIGLLAGAFNSMTGQLRELVDSLEHRVADRTAELSAANEALTGEIAERHHAEDELRRSKDFAETVLNSMSESIAIINIEDLTIVGANKVFLEAANASSAEELLGLTCYAVTHGRTEQCCPPDDICPLVDLESGVAFASVEHVHYDASGEARHAEVSVSPIHDDNGKITRVVHVSRDITERKRAETELRDYSARLEHALQDLGQAQTQLLQAQKLEAIGGLAAGIAHEINTPIQYVADNTRFLQDAFADLLTMQKRIDELIDQNASELSDATRAEYREAVEEADVEYLVEEVPVAIEQAIDGVHRVAEIVRALKDFSHPGGDTKTPLDLNKLVANTIAVCKNEWKYVAEVDTDFAEELPPVPLLSGPMGQALLILIVNAAQAIADTLDDGGGLGSITIATSVDDEYATIAVTDTGGGIPDEIREKIFEHFFTTKDVGKGSGQGLAIARSIVAEQHGGEIDFASTLGEGTTFRIRVPLELAEAEADEAA